MRNKNTKKLSQKIISSFLAFIMVFTLSTVSSIKSFAQEVLTQKVHVIVENTTYSKKDGAAWDGTLVDDWVKLEDNMTMMDAIVKALDKVKATQTGAENNYISEINGLKAFDGGSSSGWMGTKNDWFVNLGFGAFKVKANDEIRVMYTTKFGSDIGGNYSKNDTSLKNIDFSEGSLSPKFSSETKEYTLALGDTNKITVKPTAANKNYQVRVYKGDDVDTSKEGYKRSEEIKVLDGETIKVICGDKSWPGSGQNIEASTYTFKIKSNIKSNTAPIPSKESDSASIKLGETYSLDLSKIFRDEENDKLTYTVSVDNKEEVDADSNYSFKPEKSGNYKLKFIANDGKQASKPYTLNLSVGDEKAYEIKTLDTENGQISVDVKEGKLNTKVTLTVKPDENFAMDTLEIKDKDGNDIKREIDQDKSDGINYIYTFEIPSSDVKIKATFDKAYTYSIEGHDWPNMYSLEVYNRYGEIVKPKKVVETDWGEDGKEFEKGYYHLTAGEYKYTFFGYEKNIGRKGTFQVENTKEEQSKTFFPFNIYINENKLNEKDSNKVNIEITDPDGNILDIKPGKVYEYENIYYSNHYVLEAKGEDKKYKIKVTPVDKNVNYTFTTQNCDSNDQIYTYVSAELDGSNCTGTRTIKVYLQSKSEDPIEYRVNKGAGLHLYNIYGEAYRELFEVKPLSVDTSNKEYDSYKFQVPSDHYKLVAGGGDTQYVKTTKPYFYLDTEKVKEAITLDLVKKEDYEENPYYRNKWDDIYTNITDEGSHVNMNVGDTQKLETFRVWQGMTSPVSNKFVEPDKHYEVIYGKDNLSIEEKGKEGRKYVNMTGKKEGIAVIKITYDPLIEGQEATSDPGFDKKRIYGFNAIDKEQTGIVIVNVGGSRGNIDPNFKVRDRKWTKYDTVYFTGDTTYPDGTVVKGKGYGEYTFTPSKGVTVETHDPIHIDSDFANNWTKYEADKNGSYTIKVKTGRNIIRMTSGDNVLYYVLDAMESDISISNDSNKGKELKVGDKASVSFTNLEVPIYKMASIYNPGFPDRTFLVYDLNGETIEGPHKQYSVNSPLTFTIDKKGTYKLSKGKVHAQHMGSPLDTHCKIPQEGLSPNFNAGYGDNDIYFNIMPDIQISVDDEDTSIPRAKASANDEKGGKATVEKVSEDADNKTAKYKLTATANENYKFEGWSLKGSDEIVSTDAEYEVEIDKNTEYVANFKLAYIQDKTLRYTVLEDGTLSVKEPLDENVTQVVIPSEVEGRKVVEIGDRAFYSCQKLTKVELGQGLKVIKARAFMTCTLLESIEIPETVEELGQSVFAGCEKMKSAKLPSKSLKTIPRSLFNGCKSLESIEIPEGITVLKDSVFTNCVSLKEITLPKSLTNIEYPEMVFRYCQALKTVKGYKGTYAEEFAKKYNYTFVDLDVKMPEATVSVNDEKGGKATAEKVSEDADNKTSKYKLTATANENYEFEGWSLKGSDEIVSTDAQYQVEIDKNTEYVANFKLAYIQDKTLRYTVLEDGTLSVKEPLDENVTQVVIPAEVEGRKVVEIEDRAFYSCQKLTKVELGQGLKVIKARAFMTCTLLESIEIPETVEELGQSVFAGCEKMKSAKLPSKSLKTIPRSLFNGCKSLESIEIPEGITVLKDSVFTNCVSLKEITLPKSLTNIEYPEMVFRYCQALKTVKGYKGTYAEEFAKKYNYTFVDLDVKMPEATVSVNDEKGGKATAEKVSEDADNKTSKYKLTATANKGYIFMGWASKEDESKILSEDETYSVTISKDSEYVAIFKKENKDPQATIASTPAKGGSAKAEMKSNDKKEETATWILTAKANENYDFVGWIVKGTDKVVSTNATYEVTIDKDTEYVAKFKYVGEYPQVSLDTNEEKGGEVSFELLSKNEDDLTSKWKLKATTNKGYKFVKWVKSGDEDTILSEDAEYTVTISEDTKFIAVFEKEKLDNDNTDDNDPSDNNDKDDNDNQSSDNDKDDNNNQSSDNDKDKDDNNNQSSDDKDDNKSDNNTNQNTNNNDSNSSVKTGDQSSIWLYSGICIIAVCILGFVIFNKRKKS
ncbi:leucine-rich repeat protein [Terrisporobacter petrolearius]|uniref:leucine-rich repeat protein n=1 Tax=Terrisporobacter petrolearius TaxID=1460447 RepID=UPI003B00AFA8